MSIQLVLLNNLFNQRLQILENFLIGLKTLSLLVLIKIVKWQCFVQAALDAKKHPQH